MPVVALQHASPDVAEMPCQAASDEQVIRLWLHGRSKHTQGAYLRDATRFLAFAQKPIGFVTVGDVHNFADSLAGLADSSRARSLSAIKSLLAFARRIGYTHFDVGAAIRIAATRNRL